MAQGAIAGLACGMLLIGSAGSRAAAADPPDLRIGLVQTMFRDVNPGMVSALAKPFKGLMERQAGATGDVELVPDAHALARKLDDESLQIGVLHGFEYAWVKDRHPGLTPIVITHPHGRVLHACVVVHKDCPACSPAELKGDCVAVPKGIKAHCPLYLDHLRRSLPADAVRPSAKTGQTTEDVLNAVAAGDCPAALVDAGAFAGYQSLQPGAAKHLKVLCQSDPFPPSVVLYKKGALDEAVVARLRTGLTDAHKIPQYKPLLLLWNLKGFEVPPAEYAAQLDDVRRAYPAPLPVQPVSRVKTDTTEK